MQVSNEDEKKMVGKSAEEPQEPQEPEATTVEALGVEQPTVKVDKPVVKFPKLGKYDL